MLCVKVAGSLVILFDFLVHGERTENGRFMASLTVGSRDLWDTAWVCSQHRRRSFTGSVLLVNP